MSKLSVKYISIIFSIYAVSLVFDTVYIRSIFAILFMGLVLLLVNLAIKPILLLIALPFNIFTFGLFSFVVNALTIMIADGLVSGVHMGGFLNCLIAAVVIVIFNNFLLERNRRSGKSEDGD